MAKLSPAERWKKHVLEHFAALEMSGELVPLRTEGLAILGRTTLLTVDEWWHPDWRRKRSSPEYFKWSEKCDNVGRKFGLAAWTVSLACLLKDFEPSGSQLVLESEWPRISVVTENTDSLFLEWLCYETGHFGMPVILRTKQTEIPMIYMNPGPPQNPLTAASSPPRDSAFYTRIETPLNYPPEAAMQLQKKASQLRQELLRRLGYSVSKRLRSSPLVDKAKQLKANKKRLTEKESLEVIENLQPGHDMLDDLKLLQLSKSRKYKVRRRIVKPYEPNP